MDLTGQWEATIIYGKEYREDKGKELCFQMDLVQYGDEIAGTAIDTGGIGVSPDPATILGKVINNDIEFIKRYDSSHYLDRGGKVVVDRSRRGHKIKYSASFNETNQIFTGVWTIRIWVLFLWFIPIVWSCNGTWTMKRK
jgi:hypothetical protein